MGGNTIGKQITEKSQMKYTAKVHEPPQWAVVQKGTEWGYICITAMGDDEANAKRIAACLNACEGFNPDVIREVYKALLDLFHQAEKVVIQSRLEPGVSNIDISTSRARNVLERAKEVK